MEFFLCVLCGASALESSLESSGNSVPIMFVCGGEPSIILVKGPYGPVLNPVFDVFSLDKPQKKCGSFHGVINLIHTNIGQAVEVNLFIKVLASLRVPSKYLGGFPPNFSPPPPAAPGAAAGNKPPPPGRPPPPPPCGHPPGGPPDPLPECHETDSERLLYGYD